MSAQCFAVALWKSITGQAAVAVPPLEPEPTFHSSAYNISLNLTSLITFPSRLLSRIRQADVILFQDAISTLPSPSTDRAAVKSNPLSGSGPNFPGPYGFFLSGYMLGLVLLAVLLHRIQNIVVPARTSSHSRNVSHGPNRRFYGSDAFRRLSGAFLPLDLTQTSTRLAFHLPTLYFLSKMLLIWTVILLQTSELYPTWDSGRIYSLGQWAQNMEMNHVCWRTFCTILAAFAVEAFIRGLDGSGFALMHMNANTSPFNLVGYSFLLHLYASPITHVHKPPSMPSRPDKHVIVTITIPLLQLTIFHMLSIRKRWSNHRLLPTALSSFLSLLHFHLTLYSHYYHRSAPPLAPLLPHPHQPKAKLPHRVDVPATPTPLHGSTSFPVPTPPIEPVPPPPLYNLYSRPTGSGSFPLLNYVPNAFETLLLLTIALTVVLNALTQLILTGRVARPLLGLGLTGSTSGAWAWAPPYDEEWGVVLLRVGTASLEATGLRGWGNEMPAVNAAPMVAMYPEYGTARLGPSGVVHVSSGFGPTGAVRKRRRGLSNEVRTVDVGARAGAGSRIFGTDLINLGWLKEAWRFLCAAWVAGRGLLNGIRAFTTGWSKARSGQHDQRDDLTPGDEIVLNFMEAEIIEDDEEEAQDEDHDDVIYGRFLREEEISDDDDADPAQGWDLGDSSPGSEDEDEQEQERELGDGETVGLYTDLGGTTPAPVLLAHMTRDDSLPLTRRRYGSLVDAGPAPQVTEVVIPPVASPAPAQPIDDFRRNCVICTSEIREIICWPCRCLSMCDGCREVLAGRSAASKHRCPCCRQSVEGYSRIFIP
ncbi:hypothetical protein C8R45DRAFT_1208587 [Mycena sanguinolenta]|nr:hypothetical protein C8R45DRAFT_1208587 [Mycena sanguinolenta]